jgi:hypothetical protein
LRTHKVNGTRQPILVTAKTGNQMDIIDLEDETIDAGLLHSMAVTTGEKMGIIDLEY